jgi:hypothetical protein
MSPSTHWLLSTPSKESTRNARDARPRRDHAHKPDVIADALLFGNRFLTDTPGRERSRAFYSRISKSRSSCMPWAIPLSRVAASLSV